MSREEIVRRLLESDPEWLVLQEIDKSIGKQLIFSRHNLNLYIRQWYKEKNQGKLFI